MVRRQVQYQINAGFAAENNRAQTPSYVLANHTPSIKPDLSFLVFSADICPSVLDSPVMGRSALHQLTERPRAGDERAGSMTI